MSSHTDPFWDTCSVAFCLRATAEWGEEGIVSSELLAMALPQPVSPVAAALLSTVCPHPQPLLQPLGKRCRIRLQPPTGSDPCSSPSQVPGLLIALGRAIGCLATTSPAQAPPVAELFELGNSFLRRLLRPRSQDSKRALRFRVQHFGLALNQTEFEFKNLILSELSRSFTPK